MPEVVNTALALNRIRDEQVKPTEATPLYILFSADIVHAINEVMNFIETDLFDWAYGFSMDEAMNLGETLDRTILSVGDFLIKVIDEAVESTETAYFKITTVIEEAIVKVIHEWAWIVPPIPWPPPEEYTGEGRPVLVRVRIRQERQQIYDRNVYALEEIVVKVIDEVERSVETSVKLVITVISEIVKVVNETIGSVESSVHSVVYVLGIVKVVNEQVGIFKEDIISPIVYLIGQLTGMFRVIPRLRGVFRINQDIEQ